MVDKPKGNPVQRQSLLYLFVGIIIGGIVMGSLVALLLPTITPPATPTGRQRADTVALQAEVERAETEVHQTTSGTPVPTSVPFVQGTVIANRLESVAVAPDGAAMAVSLQNMGSGGVLLNTFSVGANLTGRQETFDVPAMFSKMRFSPDGKWLVGSTRDGGGVGLYNVAERRQVERFNDYNSAAFSADGKTLFLGGGISGIRILDMSSGSPSLQEALAVSGYIYHLEVSPDGLTLAVAVSTNDGKTSVMVYNRANLQAPPKIYQLEEYVMDMTYHPSGQLLAIANGYKLQIFDLLSGSQRLFSLPELNKIFTVTFSPRGDWLAVGGGNSGDGTNNLIYAWRWDESGILRPDEQWLEQRTLTGHSHIVTSLMFMPDGSYLLSASHDGSVRLWNYTQGIEISRWQL